jgi:hypothetical protein
MWSLLWSVLAYADCPTDPLGTSLSQAASMEAAFIAIDDTAFDAAYAKLKTAVPCIAEPLGASDAVTLHRAMALGSFVDGDDAASRRSLTAVRVLQPGWTPPVSLMAPGTPIRDIWDGTKPDDPRAPIPAPPPGGFRIDGSAATDVPTQRAYIVQAVDANGKVDLTRYLHQPDLLPRYDAPATASTTTKPAKESHPMRIVGLVGAGTLAAGGAVAALGAQSAASDVKTDAVPQEDVHTTAQRARTLAGAAAGLGGAAVGIGIVTAVRW